jgi:hypothetical protein
VEGVCGGGVWFILLHAELTVDKMERSDTARNVGLNGMSDNRRSDNRDSTVYHTKKLILTEEFFLNFCKKFSVLQLIRFILIIYALLNGTVNSSDDRLINELEKIWKEAVVA